MQGAANQIWGLNTRRLRGGPRWQRCPLRQTTVRLLRHPLSWRSAPRTRPIINQHCRALNLRPKLYDPLRKHFHSSAIKLDQLAAVWTQAVLRLFLSPVRVNGRLVVVGDGIKVPKRGKKMPAVKLLHQQSNCSTKPEYIMGHSLQAASRLNASMEPAGARYTYIEDFRPGAGRWRRTSVKPAPTSKVI
jgi:hypothetical protein